MIGRLTGRLILKQPPFIAIDVGGVGYECEAPMSTFYKLPAIGETVTLQAHLVVREDAQLLYAFATSQEKSLFRDLIKVSGIGPKIGLATLSGIGVEEFWSTIRNGEIGRLTKIPGIGRKTAERLLVELKDKAGAAETALGTAGAPAVPQSPVQEARAALEALGYRPAEAQKLTEAVSGDNLSAEQIIREALRRAVR